MSTLSLSGERVCILELPAEPRKIVVGRVELGTILYGDRGQVSIRSQIAGGSGFMHHRSQNFPVALAGVEQRDTGPLQPAIYDGCGVLRRQWLKKDTGSGRDA